jgi:hypothetical protein
MNHSYHTSPTSPPPSTRWAYHTHHHHYHHTHHPHHIHHPHQSQPTIVCTCRQLSLEGCRVSRVGCRRGRGVSVLVPWLQLVSRLQVRSVESRSVSVGSRPLSLRCRRENRHFVVISSPHCMPSISPHSLHTSNTTDTCPLLHTLSDGLSHTPIGFHLTRFPPCDPRVQTRHPCIQLRRLPTPLPPQRRVSGKCE